MDAEFHHYTAMWNIYGAQKAKRKRDWVEIEIEIPETWWRLAHTDEFKNRLAEEVEKGFISMIDVLHKSKFFRQTFQASGVSPEKELGVLRTGVPVERANVCLENPRRGKSLIECAS